MFHNAARHVLDDLCGDDGPFALVFPTMHEFAFLWATCRVFMCRLHRVLRRLFHVLLVQWTRLAAAVVSGRAPDGKAGVVFRHRAGVLGRLAGPLLPRAEPGSSFVLHASW